MVQRCSMWSRAGVASVELRSPIRQGRRSTRRNALKFVLSREFPRSPMVHTRPDSPFVAETDQTRQVHGGSSPAGRRAYLSHCRLDSGSGCRCVEPRIARRQCSKRTGGKRVSSSVAGCMCYSTSEALMSAPDRNIHRRNRNLRAPGAVRGSYSRHSNRQATRSPRRPTSSNQPAVPRNRIDVPSPEHYGAANRKRVR